MAEHALDRRDEAPRSADFADELARKSRHAIARVRRQLGDLADHLRGEPGDPDAHASRAERERSC